MDLAVYINELLRQQAKLSIPGLGMFSQVRKDGCYHEDNQIFSPPHYETHFEEQSSDDETLARYISNKKKISVASATYFVEKYVNTIRQQSATAEVQLNQIGWLHTEDNMLAFRPNAVSDTYEQAYFGLPALSVNKIWEQLSGAKHVPETVEELPEAIAAPPVITTEAPAPTPELSIFPEVLTLRTEEPAPAKPAKAHKQPMQDIPEDESEPKQAFNPWILVLVIVTVAAIILLALYQYRPNLFSRRGNASAENIHAKSAPAPVAKPAAAVTATPADSNTDTAAKNTATALPATTKPNVTKDSALADISVQTDQPAAPVNAARYQIMAGAFGNLTLARQQIQKYRRQGLTAWVFENRSGRSVKITQGTFSTYEEAAARLQQLKAANKAIKDAYILRPKKTT